MYASAVPPHAPKGQASAALADGAYAAASTDGPVPQAAPAPAADGSASRKRPASDDLPLELEVEDDAKSFLR